MSRIFWDTNLFIYLLEDYGELSKHTAALRSRMLARGDQLITSTLTVGEILVKPMEQNEEALCRRYEEALANSAIIVAFTPKSAKIYASLRSDRSIRPPDAIQLACAASAGVDLFVTNDARLHKKYVEGIQFIVPLERSPA